MVYTEKEIGAKIVSYDMKIYEVSGKEMILNERGKM